MGTHRRSHKGHPGATESRQPPAKGVVPMEFEALLLSRIQFGFTISVHIIFPAFSIGSSAFVATLLVLWRRTGRDHYHRLARFWTKIFAVSFAMGVVSGIPLSYELGANWSRYA